VADLISAVQRCVGALDPSVAIGLVDRRPHVRNRALRWVEAVLACWTDGPSARTVGAALGPHLPTGTEGPGRFTRPCSSGDTVELESADRIRLVIGCRQYRPSTVARHVVRHDQVARLSRDRLEIGRVMRGLQMSDLAGGPASAEDAVEERVVADLLERVGFADDVALDGDAIVERLTRVAGDARDLDRVVACVAASLGRDAPGPRKRLP
jgi:hypothetical protein